MGNNLTTNKCECVETWLCAVDMWICAKPAGFGNDVPWSSTGGGVRETPSTPAPLKALALPVAACGECVDGPVAGPQPGEGHARPPDCASALGSKQKDVLVWWSPPSQSRAHHRRPARVCKGGAGGRRRPKDKRRLAQWSAPIGTRVVARLAARALGRGVGAKMEMYGHAAGVVRRDNKPAGGWARGGKGDGWAHTPKAGAGAPQQCWQPQTQAMLPARWVREQREAARDQLPQTAGVDQV
jgi:hypothetical protein